MFDNLTARGRVLLSLGAAGAVIGSGMTALAVSSSASGPDISLDPGGLNNTTVNLLDTRGDGYLGYNQYDVTPTPVQDGFTGIYKVHVDVLSGKAPTIEVLDQYGCLLSDLGSIDGTSGDISLGDSFVPGIDQVAVVGDTSSADAPSSANVTVFMAAADQALTDASHTSAVTTLNWISPKTVSASLTVPPSIAGGDAIDASATLSPALAPTVLNEMRDNGDILFDYYDDQNNQLGYEDSWPQLSDHGVFSSSSDNTDRDASGLYKTKLTLFSTPDTLGSSALHTVGTTNVVDYNVGQLDVQAPTTANVNSGFDAARVPGAVKTASAQFCGCDYVDVRSGTHEVDYTAQAFSEDDHPAPVAGAPVEFNIYSYQPLTANGVTVPANTSTKVTAPTDSNGIATLKVISQSASAEDEYFINTVSNGVYGHSLCVFYDDPRPFDVITTPENATNVTHSTATLTSTIVDQWNQPIDGTGYSVEYISSNEWATKLSSKTAPSVKKSVLDYGRNAIDDTAEANSSGQATDVVHDAGDPLTDGADAIFVVLWDGNDFVCVSANDVQLQWVQDVKPAFMQIGNYSDFGLHKNAPKVLSSNKLILNDTGIPIDTSKGTDWFRSEFSQVELSVHVTNGELPAVPLIGQPVTFSGPTGSQFFDDNTGQPLSSPTVLTNSNGDAYVLASTTKTGKTVFTATSGAVSKTDTENFINLPVDVRNITMSQGQTLQAGTPETVTATALDIFGNPVPGVPVDFAETGAGRFANGGHTGGFQTFNLSGFWCLEFIFGCDYLGGPIQATGDNGAVTGNDGTQSIDLTSAAAEAGASKVVATVDENALENAFDWGSQINDPANFIGDTYVPGQSAGNGSATSTTSYVLTPTFSVPPVVVAAGPVPVIGKATPGSTVTLLTNGVAGPTTTAGPDGSFGFAPVVTKTTAFAVSANGLTAPAQTVTFLTMPQVLAAGATRLLAEHPSKPSIKSPKQHQLSATVKSSPLLKNIRVDWYLADAKGHASKYLASTRTNSKGVSSLLVKKLKSKSKLRVLAFVHGIAGKVSGNWSPPSSKVTIK